MSAADEIPAAIDKLTGLRERATPGAWRSFVTAGEHWHVINDELEVVASIATNDGDDEPTRAPSADLIQTLHATIAAQLEILADALKLQQIADRSSYAKVHRLVLPGLRLARAINGGA